MLSRSRGSLVVGTDHAAEPVTGIFTKHGDGAADVVPLNGLTKRRVRAIAEALGAPGRRNSRDFALVAFDRHR